MTPARNEHTGDALTTGASSGAYRDGWDRVFGGVRKSVAISQQSPYPAGIVVGPCACGSWPGGLCLKCPQR